MEETNERIGNSDKRRSAKIEVIGGGGLGGILMVGGTLAALALIGVFTDMAKKKRREPFEGEGKKKQDSTEKFEQRSNKGLLVAGEIEEEGLGSVVQISSSSLEGSLCGRSGSGQGTQIESSISKAVKVGDQFDDQECNNEDDVVEKAIEQIEGTVELSRTDYVDDQIVFEENLTDQLQEQDSNSFDDDDDDDK
ncbi:hypothetical protein Scep_030746 [Stephania cephalantha]|uniref:Uncharacterized protein n=1 Tax=Stephania cephalantha TaxID=152367 RepID=A0AAP0E318_9MAGN